VRTEFRETRRTIPAAALLLGLFLALALWPRASPGGAQRELVPPGAASPVAPMPRSPLPLHTAGAGDRSTARLDADFPLAARLNAPDSSIERDLETLQQIFDAWRSHFPRDGNPVGENAEITAALAGDNRLALPLIPASHPAIAASGELCDRWGTPFRFHQLSGDRMEIRSAGPDRKFATEDDVVWTPQ
jgi:hypothetical protein